MKVLKADLEAAYLKEEDIYKQLEDAVNSDPSDPDTFWKRRITHEFKLSDKKNKKFGDIWKSYLLVNGHIHKETYCIWRDYPNYYGSSDGSTMEEVLAKSETEKILFQGKKYRISLIRDTILPPTDTYWGFRIQPPKYALLDSKGNVIYKDDKKWRFTEVLLNGYEEKDPEDFVALLKRKTNPFRYRIINILEHDKIDDLLKSLDIISDFPSTKCYWGSKHTKDHWVVVLMGMDRAFVGSGRNATWFIVKSKKKPDFEFCMRQLKESIDLYDKPLYEVLEQMQSRKVNLNKLDFTTEDRICYVVEKKLSLSFPHIFGRKTYKEVFQHLPNETSTTNKR